MGFLFGYRDPEGVRAEWQAAAGIADLKETTEMSRLVNKSTNLIRTLPWAVPDENDGKGPFEPSEIDTPDFAIIHCEYNNDLKPTMSGDHGVDRSPVLASVSSTVWEATNISIVSCW